MLVEAPRSIPVDSTRPSGRSESRHQEAQSGRVTVSDSPAVDSRSLSRPDHRWRFGTFPGGRRDSCPRLHRTSVCAQRASLVRVREQPSTALGHVFQSPGPNPVAHHLPSPPVPAQNRYSRPYDLKFT